VLGRIIREGYRKVFADYDSCRFDVRFNASVPEQVSPGALKLIYKWIDDSQGTFIADNLTQ